MTSPLTPPGAPTGLMKLSNRWVLDGPNAWTDRTAIRVILDCTAVDADMESRLQAIMAGFSSSGADERPFDAGQVLAHLIIDLQQTAGESVSFAWSAPGDAPGVFDVVCEYYRSALALSAANLAVRILNHVVLGTEPDFDFSDAFDRRVMRHIRNRKADLQREPIVRAAEKRDLPIREVTETIRLLEIGSGVYQERFVGLMSSRVREAPSRLARNKLLTLSFLRENGIPVPVGGPVKTVDDALAIAERIGYPVVVKPVDRGHGRGVFVDIDDPEALREFAARSLQTSNSGSAMVERFIPGRDYRVFVLGETIAGVAERIPAHVIGDGRQTIAELIAEVNSHPDRGTLRVRIEIDEATTYALDRQGLTLHDVPEAGRHVLVKLVSNGSQGGTTADRTGVIHPENARFATMTAQLMGMTVCGVDLRMPDITVPIWESGGVILEMNAEPGFHTHIHVEEGEPRDIGEALVTWLFPPGEPFRPLTLALTSSPHAAETALLLERMMRESGRRTGLASREGVRFDGSPFGLPPAGESAALRRVMRSNLIDCAILETDPGDIAFAGLPFRHVDTALMLPDAQRSSPGPRDLGTVLANLVVSDGTVVIDADDPGLGALWREQPHRWLLIGSHPDVPEIVEHAARGGRAVHFESDAIVLRAGGKIETIVPANHISLSGTAACMLRATAAALASGVSPEAIRAAVSNER